MLTFLFEKHATLSYDDRHIAVDETFALLVCKRYGNICVFDACL